MSPARKIVRTALCIRPQNIAHNLWLGLHLWHGNYSKTYLSNCDNNLLLKIRRDTCKYRGQNRHLGFLIRRMMKNTMEYYKILRYNLDHKNKNPQIRDIFRWYIFVLINGRQVQKSLDYTHKCPVLRRHLHSNIEGYK